jgi:hypothetical protein
MTHRKYPRRFVSALLVCCVVFLLSFAAVLQTAQAADEQSPATKQQVTPPNSVPVEGDTKISPEEAQKLFQSVDEILQFASQDTGLPIKHTVKRRLVSRDEVEAYLAKGMKDDKDTQRLRRSELVLKKFGLLPRNFDLQKFLLVLLKEQVAGYYDPKTKTVNLLDWLPADQQRPVLAHELTHALQDQSFNLEKWMKPEEDLDDKKNITWADIVEDEDDEARQAVVEGQAMAVLVDYVLKPMGQSLITAPQVAEAMSAQMMEGTPDSVAFTHAPMFLKQALTFPYTYGLEFTAQLLRTEGKEKAFAGAFMNPPSITRQIMEPQTYLSGETIPPMPMPDFGKVFKDYDRFDVGSIGQFDVSMLMAQYAGLSVAQGMAPYWRGGYYYAVYPKHNPNSPLGLLYISRWSNLQEAENFAAIYAKSLAKRYQHVSQPASGPPVNMEGLQTLTGTHSWDTEEGPVIIDVQKNTVIVTESLTPAITNEVQDEVAGASVAH